MALYEKIDSILSARFWKFDGLPEQVISKIDVLLEEYKKEDILKEMHTLLPNLEAEVKRSREGKAGSGIAGEMQMAIGMRLKYLQDCIEYVSKKNK